MRFTSAAPKLRVVGFEDASTSSKRPPKGTEYSWWTTKNFLLLVGKDSRWPLTRLIQLAICLAILNLGCSYLVREFSTALERRNQDRFVTFVLLTIGAHFVCSRIAALSRQAEDSLVLRWRHTLTQHLFPLFVRHREKFTNNEDGSQHGDQRLTEDVKIYSARSLSFALIVLSSILSLIGFSAILWSISLTLLGAAFGYAAIGSILAVYRGRPLLPLLNDLANAEALYRYSCIELKNGGGGEAEVQRSWAEVRRIQGEIIPVNSRITAFTSFYDYLKQIIPIVLVAPSYMRGEIEFGVIGQSLVAFNFVVNAFSVIVKEIESISFFLAVVSRLGRLWQKLEVLELASNYTEAHTN